MVSGSPACARRRRRSVMRGLRLRGRGAVCRRGAGSVYVGGEGGDGDGVCGGVRGVSIERVELGHCLVRCLHHCCSERRHHCHRRYGSPHRYSALYPLRNRLFGRDRSQYCRQGDKSHRPHRHLCHHQRLGVVGASACRKVAASTPLAVAPSAQWPRWRRGHRPVRGVGGVGGVGGVRSWEIPGRVRAQCVGRTRWGCVSSERLPAELNGLQVRRTRSGCP